MNIIKRIWAEWAERFDPQRDNKRVIKMFISQYQTDRLVHLLGEAEAGKLDYGNSSRCLLGTIGIRSGCGYFARAYYEASSRPMGKEAERAFLRLGDVDASRNYHLVPLVREVLRTRNDYVKEMVA